MKLNVIDLFCGCGGLSEGFKLAGCNVIGGIDFNSPAIKTYQRNFPTAKALCVDLLEFGEEDIRKNFGDLKKVDIIIGGPPCQGFSNANRYKNEEDDPRNKLFFEFVKFVDLAQPKAILIENVRGIVTSNNGYAKDRIYEIFESRGYSVNHRVLDASEYGVPQKRLRNFFVMLKKEEKFDFDTILKSEYEVTVKDAISELYNFEDCTGFTRLTKDPMTDYQKYLRNDANTIYNHEVRYPAEKVQERISYVPQGGNWQDVPERLWPTQRNNRHSSAYKRLDENKPSVTIDTGNNHSNYFHPLYNRIPTVREAARLQSFPDDFIFEGNRSEQYRQVGNAVPPLLSKKIAEAILRSLDKKKISKKNKIIDLFCGCGGLSKGFEMAGFEVKAAIDLWDDAIKTFNHNHKGNVAVCEDIHNWDDEYLESIMKEEDICGIVGGPPCQGYSTVGTRDVNDPRNHLYKEYCRIVEKVKPDFFVIENVKGLLTLSNGAFKDDIINRFSALGYIVKHMVLNAADYGVPQNRYRVFFVGTRSEKFEFPKPFNFKVTTYEALSDLPSFDKNYKNEYICEPSNEYQRKMRIATKGLFNHEPTNHTEATVKIISMIKDGGSIKDLPDEYWNVRKYNKAFQRMYSLGQSNTVDTGHRNYFHYSENRIPSVRENARLQSFPDDFIILGSKTSQYKQVGNAVPPLLAYAVAKAIKEIMSED